MKFYQSIFISFAAIGLCACNNGSPNQISVTSRNPNANVFAANISNTTTNTYTLKVTSSSPSNETFQINASLPSSQFSITNNTCQNLSLGQDCTMSISFTPTAETDYLDASAITFSATGNTTPNIYSIMAVPATVDIETFPDPDSNPKTDTMVAVAGHAPVEAEIDTGSQLLVVAQDAVGTNIHMTTQEITLDYGQGENILYGYLGYGSVSFTTTDHQTITTSSNTPIVVVPDIPQGDYQAILGMELNNQVSARLYLPYPYNQMFVLDRNNNKLTFGALTSTEMADFGTYQLTALPSGGCAHSEVSGIPTATCWNDSAINVSYQIDGGASYAYPTLFDSGASVGSVQYLSLPSWATDTQIVDSKTYILNTMTPSIVTSKGTLAIPIATTTAGGSLSGPGVLYDHTDGDKVNLGNDIFADYKVLFDQADGLIGLKHN